MPSTTARIAYIRWFAELGLDDVPFVGGKNASLGEMISNLAGAGVSVPGGFATTAQAYRDFLEQSGLNAQIHDALDALDVDDVNALAKTGAQIRQWVMEAPFPAQLDAQIRAAFEPQFSGKFGTIRFLQEDLFVDPAARKAMISWECTLTSKDRAGGWRGLDLIHFDAQGRITLKETYAKAEKPLMRKRDVRAA